MAPRQCGKSQLERHSSPLMMRLIGALTSNTLTALVWGIAVAILASTALFPLPACADDLAQGNLNGDQYKPLKHPKISGTLLRAESALRQLRPLPHSSRVMVDANGIQVYIFLNDYDEGHVSLLTQLGVQIERVEPALKVIQARVPVGLLESVAQFPWVRTVREPPRPYFDIGSRTTEGDSVLGSDATRSSLGVRGNGIRIGVIQSGFNGIADSQASGDLPANITTFTARSDNDFAGDGAEGTAMLEIIYDVAPGAQLFAASFGTSLEEIAAVNWLTDVAGGPNPRRGTSGGVDIIVDDISWFNLGPYDGSSALSKALTAAVDRGVAYFKSAGNRAEQHWRGFYSHCPGSNFHHFNAPSCGAGQADETLNIRLPADGSFCAHLQWNEPWGSSANDYDLRLYDRSAGKFLSASDGVSGGDDEQSGTQDPAETMCFTNNTGSSRSLGIVIENFEGKAQPRQFELFLTSDVIQEEYIVSDYSVPNAGDAKRVFSVGAVSWKTRDKIESYSSRGPTLDGRLKPEVVAPDCVSVTGNGGFATTFCGTSAAAPHAGAVAALVLSANPSLTPAQLYSVIVTPTFDLGTPFPNNTFGFGRIDALAATKLALNPPTLGLSVAPAGVGQRSWIVSFAYPNRTFGPPKLFADAYFGYLRPDGVLIFVGPNLAQYRGDLNNPQSFVPLASDVELVAGSFISPALIFSAPISGPPGQYLAFFLLMPLGAGPSGNFWSMGSGTSNGGLNFQGISLAPFSVP